MKEVRIKFFCNPAASWDQQHGQLVVKPCTHSEEGLCNAVMKWNSAGGTTLSLRYKRREKETVDDLEIRQEQRLQKVIEMRSHRHDTPCVWRSVWVSHFILPSTVAHMGEAVDYLVNSISVIKSQDDVVAYYNVSAESPQSASIVSPTASSVK